MCSSGLAKSGRPAAAGVPPRDFVFLDETGANATMGRPHGDAPKGERLVELVPHGHWKVVTFVGVPTAAGLVAPFALDGPTTGPACVAQVECVLLPALIPGQVVVVDELPCHEVGGVREAIGAAGFRRPGPQPDQECVRQVRGDLAEGRGPDGGGRLRRDARAVKKLGPAERLNLFRHCGDLPAPPTRLLLEHAALPDFPSDPELGWAHR